MALDWGARRIGIAVSDDLGMMAHGLPTLVRKGMRSDMEALGALIRERAVGAVIVGDPVHMDGTAGRSSEQAKRFARRLARHAGVAVEMRDERLTSWEAEELVGPRPKDPGAKDQAAAVLLLEGYLAESRS